MRSKEDIQKEIDELESTLSERKKELEDCKLKPYDWIGNSRVYIDGEGDVHCIGASRELFNFDDWSRAERFSNKLRVLSVINNLKKSLGCDYEFTGGQDNFYLFYDYNIEIWTWSCVAFIEESMIYFVSDLDVMRVCDYLNKHHPNGWKI